MSISFFCNSMLLGVGLAMDAFSVSLANGLNYPKIRFPKLCLIAGIFAFFQFFMPLVGWFFVHTAVHYFSVFQAFVPYIALLLLSFIGGKMLLEGVHTSTEAQFASPLRLSALILQGIATSIDALSVGFTIADYAASSAWICCLLIAAVTFFLCALGVFLGKRFGTLFTGKASILGGVILICIGLQIFLKSRF